VGRHVTKLRLGGGGETMADQPNTVCDNVCAQEATFLVTYKGEEGISPKEEITQALCVECRERLGSVIISHIEEF